MNTLIIDRDLTKRAPHSPRERTAGFAIASRAVDKCRASLAGTLGEYHYDCPLDNMLFSFKGIDGGQFKTAVQAAKNYEDIGTWLLANGTKKNAGGNQNLVGQGGSWQPDEKSGKACRLHQELHPARTEPGEEQHVRLARSGRPREFQKQR
jgi:hypothetical protein